MYSPSRSIVILPYRGNASNSSYVMNFRWDCVAIAVHLLRFNDSAPSLSRQYGNVGVEARARLGDQVGR